MNKTICLVALPSPFLTDDKVFPNLGVLYLSTALKLHGVEALVHDGPITEIPQGFSSYGISATTPQFPMAKQALEQILSNDPLANVIIGGPHATVDPESCKLAGFHTVVMGYGEHSLPLVLNWGIELIQCPFRGYLMPDRKAVNILQYQYKIDGVPATSVMTSRGCPYHCAFCCKSAGAAVLHSAADVIRELEYLRHEYGYGAFMFFDDIFIQDAERLDIILNVMMPWRVKWRGFVRADLVLKLGDEMVEKMAQSGCYEVGMGIESGSEKILKVINKGESTETIQAAIRLLHRHGIRVKGFFIVGLPSESRETVDDTAQFCFEAQLDDVDFTIYQPFKGSSIYNNRERYDINWDEKSLRDLWYKGKSGEYHCNVHTSSLTAEEIVDAREYLERRFKK